MRLILVKPTNATRRLDSTGEVFHDGDHEHCTLGGPSPPAKTPEGLRDRYSGASVESSSSPQESSLCRVSSSPHERSNGISPMRVPAQMSPLKSRNLTLSQLSDQDWLLLCGQVSNIGGGSTSAESAGTSVGHPHHNDRCGCSCSDQHLKAPTFHLQPKQDTIQDCLSRVPNKRSLSTSPQIQSFSQSTQNSTSCQVLPQQANQRDLLKPASNHSRDNFKLQCSDQGGQRDSLQQQQPCNNIKLNDSSQTARPNLFNIPLNSVECAGAYPKHHQHPQPTVTAELNWREIFGTEPLLVQQCQTQESHCSTSCDQSHKSPRSPSVMKCKHLPYDSLMSTPQMKKFSTTAGNKSVQSFSTSQFSSLENQELVEEGTRQLRQVD